LIKKRKRQKLHGAWGKKCYSMPDGRDQVRFFQGGELLSKIEKKKIVKGPGKVLIGGKEGGGSPEGDY